MNEEIEIVQAHLDPFFQAIYPGIQSAVVRWVIGTDKSNKPKIRNRIF